MVYKYQYIVMESSCALVKLLPVGEGNLFKGGPTSIRATRLKPNPPLTGRILPTQGPARAQLLHVQATE